MSSKKVENHLKTAGEHLEALGKASGTSEISPNCQTAFQELKIRRKHRFIIFRIGDECIDVETIGTRSQTLADMAACLPYTDSRYCVYDHEFQTHDGRPTSKLFFITWMPLNCTTYNKMAYAHAKSALSESFTGVFDLQATTAEELFQNIGIKKAGAAEEEEDDDEDWMN